MTDKTLSKPALRKSVVIISIVAITVLLVALLSRHIADPWQYRHDDNGAWFSATARTHLLRGLGETKGQDFFLVRETNELKPYLHHPPFISLYLAAAFRLSGSNSAFTARVAVMILHLATFLIFLGIMRLLFKKRPIPFFWAAFVFAMVPMSTFFGKMPNHEVPGLFFFALAIYASLFYARTDEKTKLGLTAVISAWLLLPWSSWHSILCGLVFVPVFLATIKKGQRLRFFLASYVPLLIGLLFVVLQLLWANGWKQLPSQQESLIHWASVEEGSSAVAFWFSSLGTAAKYGRRFYADIPWVLCICWSVWAVVRIVRKPRAATTELMILSLGLGSVIYCLIFAHAVRIHAYQQFNFLPFVALSSAAVVSYLYEKLLVWKKAAAIALLVILALVTLHTALRRLDKLYKEPATYAQKASASIQQQFH